MKTLSGLGAAGLVIWKSIPLPAKIVFGGGMALLTLGEVVIEVNHAINSPEIFQGQAAQMIADGQQKQAVADASNASIENIRARQQLGQKITSTEALRLKEYEIKEAELRIRNAEATSKEIEAFVNTSVLNFVGSVIHGARGE
jgi:hypothetical protein